MRVESPQVLGVDQAHVLEQTDGYLPGIARPAIGGIAAAVALQRFQHMLADRVEWVQRSFRLLEDGRDVPAQDILELPPMRAQERDVPLIDGIAVDGDELGNYGQQGFT